MITLIWLICAVLGFVIAMSVKFARSDLPPLHRPVSRVEFPTPSEVFDADLEISEAMAEIMQQVEDQMRYDRAVAGWQTARDRAVEDERAAEERRQQANARKHAYRTNPATPGATDSESYWNRHNARFYPEKRQ